jgi:hypothetical protein
VPTQYYLAKQASQKYFQVFLSFSVTIFIITTANLIIIYNFLGVKAAGAPVCLGSALIKFSYSFVPVNVKKVELRSYISEGG